MQCKVGDLAYIKKAIRPANIGRVVTCKTLLGYFQRGESYKHNGELWVAYDTDYHWVITGSSLETHFGNAIEAIIMDSWLIPIRADNTELEDEVKELDLVE